VKPLTCPNVPDRDSLTSPGDPIPPGTLCVKCLYELGGLRSGVDAVCPECAATIGDLSESTEHIARLGPESLQRIATALSVVAWSVLVPLLSPFLGIELSRRFGLNDELLILAWCGVFMLSLGFAARKLAAVRTLLTDPGMTADALGSVANGLLVSVIAAAISASAFWVVTGMHLPDRFVVIVLFFLVPSAVSAVALSIMSLMLMRSMLIDLSTRVSNPRLFNFVFYYSLWLWILVLIVLPFAVLIEIGLLSWAVQRSVVRIRRAKTGLTRVA